MAVEVTDMAGRRIPLLYSSAHSQHAPPVELWNGRLVNYPEVPRRIETIRESLEASGLVDFQAYGETVSKDDLAEVHDRDMLNYLETMSFGVEDFLNDPENFYETGDQMTVQEYLFPAVFPVRPSMMRIKDSTGGHHGYYCFDMEAPIGKGTWDAALHAASLALRGADMLLGGESQVVYSLCRPPGHHVGPDFFGGYCYINNAALAAKRLTRSGKVALIDVDYHHGNGSQTIFWDNPEVLFGSLHAHPDEEYPFYSGYEDETGGPSARGANLNYPLHRHSSQAAYLQAFDDLMAKVRAFEPEVIVVSLGFDTYKDDPVAFFNVDEVGYHHIGQGVAALGLPLLLVQEGGYCVEALGDCAEAVVRGVGRT
jgi:acetoin utilization deacetylase AcuC-like enzyme